MGSTYAHVNLLGVELGSVVAAGIGPGWAVADGGDVVVFTPAAEPDPTAVAAALSGHLACTTLGVMVFDSDVLGLVACRDGTVLVSATVPDEDEWFEGEDEPGEPDPALAGALVAALGRGDAGTLATRLAQDEVFAEDRHDSVLRALGVTTVGVGWGHDYLAAEPAAFDGGELTALPTS